MGWKSILYFEFVSTLALFIGLAAINLSKAGVGVNLPQAMTQGTLPEVPKQTWDQVLLHVFPENIAKSIAEGQVLQPLPDGLRDNLSCETYNCAVSSQ